MSGFGQHSVPLSNSWKANVPGMASQQKKKPAGGPAAAGGGLKAKKQVILEEEDEEIGDDAEDYENFANVSTTALETFGLAPHPSPVCEAATLSSVPSPESDYSLKLPAHVLKSGAISALQFQAVRLACARHEQKLPDGSRAGFFLGDGPGVGKGRQIAATIFNYFCRGKSKAVWVSVSTDLVVDARRDLEALSMLEYEPVRLHDLRQLKTRKGKPLSSLPGLESGILFCTYDLLCSGATSMKAGKGGKAATKGKASSSAALGKKASGASLFADENLAPWERSTTPESDPWGLAEDDSASVEFGPNSRLHQIVEWLGDGDYVIVLDECHRAKNCVPKDNKEAFPLELGQDNDVPSASFKTAVKNNQGVTKTARAVIELQRRCPNARVMYVSATGASEAENLCYMERLGLWGPGSAFPNKAEFVGLLKQGGIGAMELVAMELKGAGCYLSRALSWADVKFDTVAIDASPEFVAMYDVAVSVWQDTRQFMVDHGLTSGRWGQSNRMSQFYAAQLRFFRQLCTAAKVDTVIRLCQEALDKDMCPVIGLQSTGEARTAEFVATMAQSKGADDDELVFESFVEPAALILSNFIERCLLEFTGSRSLLHRANDLLLPKNPLDDLIDRLGGAANVAEMTGRNKRMERDTQSGGYRYVKRTDYYGGCSVDDVNILERAAFQSGHKRVAIISDAASAGISLHAEKNATNTRQRVQITLELAWSADKTVQQLGRTHRSNQLTPPIYKIVSTNICGEHRFASAVAHRLQQLGALTQGDRRAASASEAMAAFNLQTKWAREALRTTLNIIITGGYVKDPTYDTLNPPWLEDMMREGLPAGQDLPEPGTHEYSTRRHSFLSRWCSAASVELNAVGLGANKTKSGIAINTVLNRLLGMRVAMQAQFFGYFSTILDKVVSKAKKDGSYDATGIIKPGCDKITLRSSQVICEHPNGAAATSHTIFDMDRGVSFTKAKKLLDDELERVRAELGDTAADRCGAGFYFSDSATTRYWSLALPRTERGLRPLKAKGVSFMAADYFRIIRPATGVSYADVYVSDFRDKFTRMNNLVTVEREWNKAYTQGLDMRLLPLHLLTGSVLPLLRTITVVLKKHPDRSGRMRRLQVMRVETSGDDLQRFIGIAVPNEGNGIVLRDLLSAIKQLENLTPEEKFKRQQAAKRKETAVGKIAAAATAFGVKPAAAAAAGSSPLIAAAAPVVDPASAGLDPEVLKMLQQQPAAAPAVDPDPAAGVDSEVLKMLQQINAAVGESAPLLDDDADPAAAAAAADSDLDQEEGDQADAGSSSDSSEDDDESLQQRQTKRRKQRRPTGKPRITRADVAAAERAAAGKGRGPAAAANVVTEGLAAAGLWEDGSSELMIRKGGAAAAGGGGTRWHKYAAAGGGSSKAAAAAAGRGRRGRPSNKDWIVSDVEADYVSSGDESLDDLALADSSDDDVAVDLAESSGDDVSDDEPQQQQPKRRQPARQSRPRRQQQQQQQSSESGDDPSEDEQSDHDQEDLITPEPAVTSWAAKRKRSDRDGGSSSAKLAAAAAAAKASLAAAGIAVGSDDPMPLDKEQQRLERKQRRMNHPAAKWQQRQQQQQEGGKVADDIIDRDQDVAGEQQQQHGDQTHAPAAAQQRRVAEEPQPAAAAAADADMDADEEEEFKSVDDLPEFRKPSEKSKSKKPATAAAEACEAAAEQSEPAAAAAAAAATKRRGRNPKGSRKSPPARAAASAAAAAVTVSSRGRIRKQKALPDDFTTLDADPGSAAAAAKPQEEPESGSESDDEPVLADVLNRQQQQRQQPEAPKAAAAAAAADDAAPAADTAGPEAAADEPDVQQRQQEAADTRDAAQGQPDHVDQPAAAAAAVPMEEQQQECDPPSRDPTLAGSPSKQHTPFQAAAAAAATPAADQDLTEASLKSKVLSLLPEIAVAVPEGQTLSVKAVRVAVESATGWKLTGSFKNVVKETCQEWVQQQQQQGDQISEAKLTEVVLDMLKTADTTTISFKAIRLAAAAALGLEDLPKGHLRDTAKAVVTNFLLTDQQQQQSKDPAAAKQQHNQDRDQAVPAQQQQASATAAAAESDDEEEFKSVDELPEFRPNKKAKPSKPAAAAVVFEDADLIDEDADQADAAATAEGGSSRVTASRSKQFDRFNKAVAAAAAGSNGRKRHTDEEQEVAEDLLHEPEMSQQQEAPAAAATAGSSKRRRLRPSAAADTTTAAAAAADTEDTGMQDLEDADLADLAAPAAAAQGDCNRAAAAATESAAEDPANNSLLDDADCLGLMDELMEDLHSPRSAAAAAGGAAAAGSGDVRGVSPVPANLFDNTPSPRKPEQNQPAAAAIMQEPAMPSAAAATCGGSSRPHRRAVIADSDDEDDPQQTPCQTAATAAGPAAATAAPAPAAADDSSSMAVADQLRTADGTLVTADWVASLQQQLAAAAAQIAELQQQRQQQRDVAAAAQASADGWKAECEQLQQEMQLLRQRQLEAAPAAADLMQIDRNGSGSSDATAAADVDADDAAPGSPAFAFKPAAVLAVTPGLEQAHAADAANPHAAAAATPGAVTPMPWGGLSKVELTTPAAAAAAAENDPPTPRMGCLAAAASVTSPAPVAGHMFQSSSSGELRQQQQEQTPGPPVTPGSDPIAAAQHRQQEQPPMVVRSEINEVSVPTLDDLRSWLENNPTGATAVQIIKAFGSGSSSDGSKGLGDALCGLLQSLVDDFEVFRKGPAAGSSAVDMCDGDTLFILA